MNIGEKLVITFLLSCEQLGLVIRMKTRDHLVLLPQKRSFLICPLLGSLWLFPSKITLSWPPLMGKRSLCSSPGQLLVAANRQRVEDRIYVDVLTPHIPRRFLYSSSRALSNAFRAASALFKSIASHSIN